MPGPISEHKECNLRGISKTWHFRDFSRFSEERPLPHVVGFGSVTLLFVCNKALSFRSARKGPCHHFSDAENWYRSGPWVDFLESTVGFSGPSRDLDDPMVGSALRTRILAIQKSDHAIQNILCSVTKSSFSL